MANATPILIPADAEDVARWGETRTRRRMLEGPWEQDISKRLNEKLTPGRVCNLGRPMQSLNLFAATVRQLAVQYDSAPTVTNSNMSPEDSSIWSGIVKDAHLWSILQKNSENVIGLRECLLYIGTTEDGIRVQSVTPDTVTIETLPGDPNAIVVIRAARSYLVDGESIPAWAVWDIKDSANPRFYVEGADGKDITRQVVVDPQPWQYFEPGTESESLPEGKPFLPFVMYRAQYTCEPWDPYAQSELVHAALDLAILWTAWNKSILDASWAQRWVIDLMLQGLSVANSGGAGATATVETDPTSILVFQSKGDKPGSVGQWEVPQDPKSQSESIISYQASVLSNIGIHPTDIESTSGPQSGVAIALKRSAQRRLASRLIPEFREADTNLFSKMAMISNIFFGTILPTEGWEIAYHLPEETVEEFIAALDRDERLVKIGFLSKVDMMMRYRPELSREQAAAKLREIEIENKNYPMPV